MFRLQLTYSSGTGAPHHVPAIIIVEEQFSLFGIVRHSSCPTSCETNLSKIPTDHFHPSMHMIVLYCNPTYVHKSEPSSTIQSVGRVLLEATVSPALSLGEVSSFVLIWTPPGINCRRRRKLCMVSFTVFPIILRERMNLTDFPFKITATELVQYKYLLVRVATSGQRHQKADGSPFRRRTPHPFHCTCRFL